MSQARTSTTRSVAAHGILILYTLIALFPVFVIVINSFKDSPRDLQRAARAARARRASTSSATPPCSPRATSCSTSRTA